MVPFSFHMLFLLVCLSTLLFALKIMLTHKTGNYIENTSHNNVYAVICGEKGSEN